MRQRNSILGRLGAALLSLALLLLPASLLAKTARAKAKTARTSSSKRKVSPKSVSANSGSAKHGRRPRHSWRRGQQTVDARRTEQIQEALIQSHYLDGEPSGAWDAKTQEALRRYQAANGWQSKVVPDSRALIKLGLGPSRDRLLNPDSAMSSRAEVTPSTAAPEANSPQH